ncbi:MAG: cytochrome c [Gammaproteobacteria bacterium]|uniref:Cytochrome c n=1 Tax=Candidatus Thiopontia autotrophica TaxID=2841688 RepID=A0A8J6P3J5_9GAMM|nr:cytochrome c [Candidatus Thiopontia autotrophica]MBL6969013.1 cytochrome c [Gammaproteobacteria bacterium]
MKIKNIAIVAALLLSPLSLADTHSQEHEASVLLPPTSIAQWYKPQNKRQVWLHTMFRLRRAMLAIQEYTALQDEKLLDKWGSQFIKDYRSITEMVPEWGDEIEPGWINRLEQVIRDRDWEAMGGALRKVGMTCSSCHDDYRAVTAALYRTPDFEKVMVEDSETMEDLSYKETMNNLTTSMNRFKIAVEDGRKTAATEYLEMFSIRVIDLGESCSGCHRDEQPRERILGEETEFLLEELSVLLAENPEGVGRKLGEVGVAVCARCHGVHRTLADLRRVVEP